MHALKTYQYDLYKRTCLFSGMNSSYMGGSGGGYNNMGSSAMSNLANPNYTAF